MTHRATKVSIVTEKLNERQIERIVEECGATGYTILEGSGKGSHGTRTRDRPSIVDAFSLVKIEAIVPDEATAEEIANRVAEDFFEDFSGIVYLEEVRVLRREKF